MFLLVIADDFTGALDTAVQFTACGIKAEVVADNSIDFEQCNTDVLVVDAETRHMTAQEAFDTVSDLVSQACKTGVKYIYKKTDSALRGNIGAELEAVMQACATDSLAFFPAFPQINRITKNGIHYIDGIEVNKSSFGRDPYEPVKYASVADIIAQQSSTTVCNINEHNQYITTKGILVFDAQTSNDLIIQGQRVINELKIKVLAGCAGFAEFLPILLKLNTRPKQALPQLAKKFLVICGSVHPITLAQLDYASQAGFTRIKLSPEQKLSQIYLNENKALELFNNLKSNIANNKYCIIESNDEKQNPTATATYAKEHQLSNNDVRERIASTMGFITKQILDQNIAITLLLTGGDTLLKCLKFASVNKLEPICELEKGVVLASFTYLKHKIYVITKSGGFGSKELLVKLAKFLQN